MKHLKSRARSGELNVGNLELVADDSSLGLVELQADCPDDTVYKVTQHQTRFSCGECESSLCTWLHGIRNASLALSVKVYCVHGCAASETPLLL